MSLGEYFPHGLVREAPPETGVRAASVRVVTIPLDTALDDKEFVVKGTLLWAVGASDITALVQLKFNDQSGTAFPFRRGAAIGGLPFSRLYVTAAAQAGKSITLLSVSESPPGAFRVINPDISFNEVFMPAGGTLDNPALVAVSNVIAQVVAASATRRSVRIYNDAGVTVYLGNATVTAANGIPLLAGETWIEDDLAAAPWYAITAAGAGNVRVQTGS